ncbi:hypothetical protein BGZ93_004332 [Podila epicladia]|nr:hypothetical protein BGZ93_004332 [Podila epicladia]
MSYSPHTRTSKTRVAIGKAILLVSVSFAALTLVHLNLSIHRRQLGPTELEEQKQLYQNLQKQQHDQQQQQEHRYPPPPSKPHSGQNDTAPIAPEPFTAPDTSVPFTIISETELTRTVQYPNGVQHKIFKDQFYKNPEAAKREMGSFFDTLATRSWWNIVPNDSESQSSEDDDEDEEEDHQTLLAKAPGRYFTYLPLGGGNNQFIALQKAALLAKDMGRTLLLPPISPNQHVKTWAGPAYSEFFDLDTFMRLSGIYVIDWAAIKQTPVDDPPSSLTRHWEDFSEELVCIPNGGIGIGNQSLYDKFRPQFLLKYRPYIPAEDTTKGKSTDYHFAKDVLLKDVASASDASAGMNTKNGQPSPDLLKCLSCPYFLGGPELGKREWDEVGVHLRFNDRTEALVDDILDILLRPSTIITTPTSIAGKGSPMSKVRRHPEFIVVHLRRGDIANKCPAGVVEKDCVVQIETIAEQVDKIEDKRRTKALDGGNDANKDVLKRLPVLVTTNEKRKTELNKIEKLGWILLDHGSEEDEDKDKEGEHFNKNTRKLGTLTKYGPWYPPMLDAVLLTRGRYMIGMTNSRMSVLASQRGQAWYGHEAMLL